METHSGVIWIPRAQFNHSGQLAHPRMSNEFQINQIENKSQSFYNPCRLMEYGGNRPVGELEDLKPV